MTINKISVTVTSQYLADQSIIEDQRYAFAYHVVITNEGEQAAKLLSRHWIITDGNEKVQEVKGPGVVGEQPHLQPGQSFQYSSGTVMSTVVGIMQGSYLMLADDGTEFTADIAPFALAIPHTVH